MAESRQTEPKVVLENAGWTVLQKTVNAVAGILWKLHVSSYGQTILEIMHMAVTACLGIALTTRRREEEEEVCTHHPETAADPGIAGGNIIHDPSPPSLFIFPPLTPSLYFLGAPVQWPTD